jgi:hypothetical protein
MGLLTSISEFCLLVSFVSVSNHAPADVRVIITQVPESFNNPAEVYKLDGQLLELMQIPTYA